VSVDYRQLAAPPRHAVVNYLAIWVAAAAVLASLLDAVPAHSFVSWTQPPAIQGIGVKNASNNT